MTLTHRRVIYAFFMVIFVILAPVINLRVSGYHYNWKKNNWQKTGMIFLETKPEEVSIYLNNQLIGDKTPIRIKDLSANKYTLRLEKPSFSNWEKEIQVVEGQTTTIQYVRLFKEKSVPKLLSAGEITKAAFNKTKDRAALLKKINADESLLILVDLNNGTELAKKSFRKINVAKMEFVDNGARLAIYATDNLKLISLNNTDLELDLRKELAKDDDEINNLKLAADSSENVYYFKNNRLTEFSWLYKREMSLLPYLPMDYLVFGNKLYFLDDQALNSIILKMVDLCQKKEPEIITFLTANDYQLSNINDQFLTLENKTKKELTIVDLENRDSELIKNVAHHQWSESGTELIFDDNYELWMYRPLEKKDDYLLFTRVSNPITAIEWYPPKSHVVYAENGLIKIMENFESNGLVFQLGEFNNVLKIVINKKGDKIFFTGQVNQVNGLYEIEIQ